METVESLISSNWLWFGVAALLLALEAFFGSFMFLAASVAALVIGILSDLYPYVGLEVQVLFFVVLSGGMIWGTRSFLKAREAKFQKLQSSVQNQSYVGRKFALVSPITEGYSSINIDGVVWQVQGEDAPAGTQVQVISMGEGVIRVERVNP